MIEKENFIGKNIILKVMQNEISAVDASIRLHELLVITGAKSENL